MALQGTIKDFGLADIFQLIGIQRKTGILTLENDKDVVSVSFLEGRVAAADTRLRNLEDLLGSVLVRTGRITEAQLQKALQTQRDTLQRLGYILVDSGLISDDELSEALRIQVSQIVYRLFRWRQGKYKFDSKDDVEYDREHFTPISAETILMEGARMIDEWPIIERKIKSDKMVFAKTEAGAAIDLPVESLVDEGVEINFDFEGSQERAAQKKESDITLSPDEREILRMVDGKSSVQDIVDRCAIGEFDTFRILYELLTRNLIEEVQVAPTARFSSQAATPAHWAGRMAVLLLFAFAGIAAATLVDNPFTPWKAGAQDEATSRLRTYASRVRLEAIEQAIRVFYLDNGTVPERLSLLAETGYLDQEDLLDPWGRPYEYQLAEGGFRLAGLDDQGGRSEDLTLTSQFTASQRMLLDGSLGGGSR